MSPDPVDVDDDDAVDAVASDLTRPAMAAATAPDAEDDADELPSYLRVVGPDRCSAAKRSPTTSPAAEARRLDESEFGDVDVEHDERRREDDDSRR